MRLEVSRTDDHAVVQNDNSTRSALDSSLVHSSTLIPPHFSDPLTIVNFHIIQYHYIFVTNAHICTTMMSFDHDKFLPPVIKLSTSPYCTNISSPYNGTNTTTTTMHNTALSATLPKAQHFPLPCKSQCTHLSTVNVHSARPIDSAHFAQPMSHDSTDTSPSLAHVCMQRQTG